MARGLFFHNIMQFSIPFWLIPLLLLLLPQMNIELASWISNPILEVTGMNIVFLSILVAGIVSFSATILPDIDHFAMWKKIRPRGFFDFVKKCASKDRHRNVFLIFHNYAFLIIISAVTIFLFLMTMNSTAFSDSIYSYAFIFSLSFLIHLLFDFLADIFMIKRQSHWKPRNWFYENIGN